MVGHQAESAVAEVGVARDRADADGREHDRDRGRRAHVLRRDLHGQDDAAALHPHRVPGPALHEGVASTRVVARRRDRDGEQVSLLDRVGDPQGIEVLGHERVERRGVEERLRHGAADEAAEHHVAHEAERAARERPRVGAEHLVHPETGPQVGEGSRRLAEVRAARRHHGPVDGPGGRAGDDPEGQRSVAHSGQLADASQHPGLIGSARAAGREDEAEHGYRPGDAAAGGAPSSFVSYASEMSSSCPGDERRSAGGRRSRVPAAPGVPGKQVTCPARRRRSRRASSRPPQVAARSTRSRSPRQ